MNETKIAGDRKGGWSENRARKDRSLENECVWEVKESEDAGFRAGDVDSPVCMTSYRDSH